MRLATPAEPLFVHGTGGFNCPVCTGNSDRSGQYRADNRANPPTGKSATKVARRSAVPVKLARLITVLSDGQPIGTTIVGAGGSWSFTPSAALGNGQHTLTVTATDSAGNTSLPSGGFTFTVDTLAPTAPVITQVADDVGPLIGNLNNGQATNDPLPTLSGTAEANSMVKILR